MSRLKNWSCGGWRAVAALSLALGLAAPLWSRSVSAQGALPETAAAAPESTVLFHEIDLDRAGSQWQQIEALLARVGVPDALDLWEEEILAEGSRKGDFSQADLDALLGGEMAIVVTPAAIEHLMAMMAMMEEMGNYGESASLFELEGTPVAHDSGMMGTPVAMDPASAFGVAAVLLPGDPDAAWDYVERQFTSAAAEKGASVQAETYNGADVLIIEGGQRDNEKGKNKDKAKDKGKDKKAKSGKSDADAMGDWMSGYPIDGHSSLAAGRAGEFIVAGMTEADVTALIDVIQGNGASLADSVEAQQVRAELPDEAVSFTYINGAVAVDAIGPELMEAWESSMSGMDAESSRAHAGVTIGADPIGFRFDTIMLPAAGGSLATATFANDPAIMDTAARAPANSFIFNAGKIPENSFAGAAYLIAAAVNAAATGEPMDSGQMEMMTPPTAEEVEAAIAEASATLGFNPQTDLFDLLGEDFILFAGLPTFDLNGIGWDAVAAISSTDPAALAETARKAAAFIDRSGEDVEVATRQIGAESVYVLSDPEMAEAPAIEFGVVDGQAVVGTEAGIADLTADPAASLAEDEQFQMVMSVLPSEAYQIGYVDFGGVIDLVTTVMAMGQDEPGAATPVADASGGPENIRALGAVAYQRGEMAGSSAVLYIAE